MDSWALGARTAKGNGAQEKPSAIHGSYMSYMGFISDFMGVERDLYGITWDFMGVEWDLHGTHIWDVYGICMGFTLW